MEATIIEAEVIEALRSCFDPEIPVNIYELGLIYDVKVDPSNVRLLRVGPVQPIDSAIEDCITSAVSLRQFKVQRFKSSK